MATALWAESFCILAIHDTAHRAVATATISVSARQRARVAGSHSAVI